MMIKTNWIFNGEKTSNLAMYIIVVLICFPLSMVLPGIVRRQIQIFAVSLFILSLILLRKYIYILILSALFCCSYLYYIGSWEEMMSASTFLYNSLICWIIVIYALLCINGHLRFDKKLFWLIVLITLITAITTIAGLMRYPLAVRELGRGESYSGTDIKLLYRKQNIASWSQVYGMAFMQGCFTYFYKETRNKIVLLTIVVTEICLLNSQLTFGILMSFVILALIIINVKSKKNHLFLLIGAAFAIALLINLESVLRWTIELSNKVGLEMLAPKLIDLYNLVINKSITGDATARLELYLKSFSAFCRYPKGLYWHGGVQATEIIGYHSEFFDLIGTLGILGVFFMIVCARVWNRKMKTIRDSYARRFLLSMFLVFIIMFVLNPVFYSPQIWIGAFALPASMVINKADGMTNQQRRRYV